MSTDKLETVDFYSGHRSTLEYLGTLWVPDGSPEGLQALDRFTTHGLPSSEEQYLERHFREAFEQLRQSYESTTRWPHAHTDSIGSDWTYRYDHASVAVYFEGVQYVTFLANGARQPYQYFPDMTKKAAG